MADAVVDITAGTGTHIDVSSLTVGSNTVNRQRMNIADPTSATAIAAVKAASTAAATTDPALVVSVSPNSIATIQGYQPAVTSGTITTTSSVVGPMTMSNLNVATVVVFGTYAGVTFTFEASPDGTNWFTVQGSRVDNGLVGTGLTTGTNLSIAWDIPVGAWTQLRVRATAWTSGTASVIIGAQSMPYDPAPASLAQGVILSGSALPTGPGVAPVLIGGGSIAGATNATAATVKAASTAAASTDTALVVSVSPVSATLVGGDIASAVTDSGSPVKIGGQARITNPTAVTDGQRVNAIFDKLGKQIVVGAARDLKARQRTNIAASTTETTIVTAIAATFNDLYGLVITNNGAAVMSVTIRDVTAGTAVMVFEVPATDTRGFMVAVDSAVPQASVNTAWTAACTPNATSADITALYVKNI